MIAKAIAAVRDSRPAFVSLGALSVLVAVGLGMTWDSDQGCEYGTCAPSSSSACLHGDHQHDGYMCATPDECTTCKFMDGYICFHGDTELDDHYDATYDPN